MSTQNNRFLALVEKAMTKEHSHMRPVIEKELLHYDILFALDNAGLLDKLTFQGGTSLRLCYGAPRFSEDLDFAGGYDFQTNDLISMKTCIEEYLGKLYGLEVTVKEPHHMADEPENRNIKISKWQIRIVTHPERRDIPKQMIKIEVGNIPAYTKQPRQLLKNYDFLPDGYSDTLVMVETLDEIMADKLVAFVDCQPRIRYRDIWDLRWLEQQGAKVSLDLIYQKINDYKIENYPNKVNEMIERLPEVIHGKEFKEQMPRFLPIDIQERTLLKDEFYSFLKNQIDTLLKNLITLKWEEGKNGEVICYSPFMDLNNDNFESTIISMETTKDNGLFVTYGKEPESLIVSPKDEHVAKKLSQEAIYKAHLPKGYKVDASLLPGQWYIRFTNKKPQG